MSKTKIKKYYEPTLLDDCMWYFLMPEVHGPGSVHPEIKGHGDLLVGPYSNKEDCSRQCGVTQLACASIPYEGEV